MNKPEQELNNKYLSLSLSGELKELVDRLRWQMQISRSKLIREALLAYVKQVDKNKEEG